MLRFTGRLILGLLAVLAEISGSVWDASGVPTLIEVDEVLPAARDSASLRNWRLSEVGRELLVLLLLFCSSVIIVRPQR